MSLWSNPRWWRFGREDYVVLRFILVAIAVVGCVPGADAVAHLARGRLRWETVEPETTNLPRLRATNAEGTVSGLTTWSISHPSAQQIVGALLPAVLLASVVIGAVWLGWLLLRRVEAGRAFDAGALRRVRQLCLLLMAYGTLGWVVRLVAELLVMLPIREQLSAGTAHLWLMVWTFEPLEIAMFLSAFVILAVVEVFRQGNRQEEELAGLV